MDLGLEIFSMIVHKIDKYNKGFDVRKYFPSFMAPKESGHGMGKLEYALYLKNLKYGVGDWVVSKYIRPPLLMREVYKVVSIDEIHRFVKFGHPSIGPMCLTLENAWGQPAGGKQGGEMYRLVEEHELPLELKGKDDYT
jgi:hypothetical protein